MRKSSSSTTFFFTFKVEGEGPVIHKAVNESKAHGVKASPKKVVRDRASKYSDNTMKSPDHVNGGGKTAKDPITSSIKERKDGGSVLTQLPSKGNDTTEVFNLEIHGKGAKIK